MSRIIIILVSNFILSLSCLSDQTKVLNFTGNVEDHTCDMSLSGNTVDFGEMSANSIYFLISRFFYLYFINCPVTGNGTIVHMKISGAESPDQKGTLAVSGVKGLVISFFVNGSSKLFVNGPSLDEWIIPESNKLNNIEVGTYLWKTGNITGGTFNSTAIIDVTYD